MSTAAPHTPREGLELAIAAASRPDRPRPSRLAAALGLRPQQISKWRRRGYVPIDRVRAVAAATGLPPLAIRPDLPELLGLTTEI